MKMRVLALFLSMLVGLTGIYAQITVQTITPEQAVGALLGDNVSYSNVTYIGDTLQLGFLDNADGTSFSLPAGIILSTDNAQNVDQAYTGYDFLTEQVSGDPDLLTIANSVPPLIGQAFSVSGANDLCILEFDFIPNGDAISFNYSFGSDEYLTWINSSFNDVFAFFLSGPGIDGSFASPPAFPDSAINLAFVPGTNPQLPITISSVQPDLNSEYYIDNPNNVDLNINGFTTSLTAFAEVQCGETYHIKLAIADGSDTALESIVVLEENSFNSVAASLDLESVFLDVGLVEFSDQCDTGFVYISRNCAADSVYYDLDWGGSATNGIDYQLMDTLLAFGVGQLDSALAMLTILDTFNEGVETIELILSASDSLYGTYDVIDTVYLDIYDTYTFGVAHEDTVLTCPNNSQILVDGIAQAPSVAPYTYTWTDASGAPVSSDPNFLVDPPGTFGEVDQYVLNMVDFCGAESEEIIVEVENAIPDDPAVVLSQPGLYCRELDYPLSADISAGTAPYTYDWASEAPGIIDSSTDTQLLIPSPSPIAEFTESSRWLYVTIGDVCTPTRFATDSIEVIFPDPIIVNIMSDTIACVGSELDLMVEASGGTSPYEFNWLSNPFGINFETDIATGEGYADGFAYDGNSTIDNKYTLTVEVDDQCSLMGGMPVIDNTNSSLNQDVFARNCIIPNIVSSNGDGLNDRFIVNELINNSGTMYIYNRWGKEIAATNLHVYDLTDHPEGTYYYVVNFTNGTEAKKGYFTLVR
jgi:gliding motility-associated-like protein